MSTLSPGVAMSPGAFWGHPGGANPFINPAVGAPVHLSPSGFYAMHPVHSQHEAEEPSDYFPPVPPPGPPDEYFPPTSLGLADAILKDKDSLTRDLDDDSVPSEATTDTGTRSRERRPSSSTDTSWRTSISDDNGDSTMTEKRGGNVSDSEATGRALDIRSGGPPIFRTHSMSPASPPTLTLQRRSESDPSQIHSKEGGNDSDDIQR